MDWWMAYPQTLKGNTAASKQEVAGKSSWDMNEDNFRINENSDSLQGVPSV